MEMDAFFTGDIVKEPFAVFSAIHGITLLAVFGINSALLVWLRKSKSEMLKDRFRRILAYLLLGNEIFYIVWSILSGSWSAEYSLPLQLCDIAVFLSAAMLLKNQYFIFEIVFFWGLGGGLQALLTPDLAYPFPHCIYFSFFLGHGAVLTSIIYMIAVKKFRPRLKSILKMFIFTNAYMAVIAVVNAITGGNYMFICEKPESASVFDFLGPWPWYLLSLEGLGLIISFICYLPFGVVDFIRLRRTSGKIGSSV